MLLIALAIYLCCALFAGGIAIGACLASKRADRTLAQLHSHREQLEALRLRPHEISTLNEQLKI